MIPDETAINRTIFRALTSALSLSASEANARIIRAYSDVPSAEPPLQRDAVYYYLQTDPEFPQLQETGTENNSAGVHSFIPCRLVLVFYGPSCESWAHRVRSFIFLDGPAHPRGILRSSGLYPVPDPQPPTIIYEETGKAWRKRADLVIDLRLTDDSTYGNVISHTPTPVDTIVTAPEVQIHRSGLT